MEDELERRLKELEHREAALKKISAAVLKNRAAAAAPAPVPEPAPVPIERRGRFGRRHTADPRVAELQHENELLRARIAELEHSSAEPPRLLPQHEPEAEAEQEPLTVSGRPTLPQLEHLALEAERRGAPQAEEWTIYLPLLREHAWLDGTIPPQFDDILRDVFGASF